MKTLIITTSTKKHRKWSNSSYIAQIVSLGIGGEKEKIHLEKKNYEKICEMCAQADNVVLAMPVYVDGIPAHVAEFLEYAQGRASSWKCRIYAVSNCGFFQGQQCRLLLNQLSCFCDRAGLTYGGGLGTGAGEMIGTLRITNVVFAPVIAAAVALIVALASGSIHSGLVSGGITLGISVALYLIWSSGVLFKGIGFGKKVSRGEVSEDIFTTVWFCGWPLFEFFACIFWVVRAAWNKVPLWKMKRRVEIGEITKK